MASIPKAATFVHPVARGLVLCLLSACHPQTASDASGPAPPEPGCQQLGGLRAGLLQAGRGTIIQAVADLFEKPALHTALADQALLGEVVTVLPGQSPACRDAADGFVRIETESRYQAFVHLRDVQPLAPGATPYRLAGPTQRVAVRLGSVYDQPTVTVARPRLLVPYDIPLRVQARVDERWQAIVLPDGAPAFVQAGDLVPPSPPQPAPAAFALAIPRASARCVLDRAQRYAGTPYLWGGRSTLGIDCSGLVLSAMLGCGLSPPRDADDQYAWDQGALLPHDPALLAPGDLLFFGTRKPDGSPKITHVGIYLSQGRFLHATTHQSPVVQESQLADEHWTNAWVGARRPPYATP